MQLLLAIARRAACTVQAALHETPVMQARACSNKSCVHVSFLGKGDSPRPAAPPACLQGRVCACVALLQTGPELVKEALGGLEEDGWGERTAGCGAARGKRPGGASATTACTQVKQQCMAMRGRQLHAQQTSCCWQQPPPPPQHHHQPPTTTPTHPTHPPTHLVKVQHHRVAQQPQRAPSQVRPQVARRQPQRQLVPPLQPAPLDGRLDALQHSRTEPSPSASIGQMPTTLQAMGNQLGRLPPREGPRVVGSGTRPLPPTSEQSGPALNWQISAHSPLRRQLVQAGCCRPPSR